ncbi:MAG: OmpA family protein [Haliea sp.]|nr:OmpA family protein [Haliea sp.]
MAENDLETDQSAGEDMADLDDRLPGSDDNENRLVTTSAGAVESALPRRRLIVMSFVAIVAITLILLMKTCFVSPDEQGFRDMTDSAPVFDEDAHGAGGSIVVQDAGEVPVSDRVEQQSGQAATLDGTQASVAVKASREVPPRVGGKAKSDASRGAPNLDISDSQQRLAPIIVTAARRPIPVAYAISPEQVEPIDSLKRVRPSYVGEAGIADGSSHEERDQVSTEAALAQERQETILISFPFDSDDLIPDSHLALDRAATMLRDNASSVASITGFTDNQGDTQYNLVLSRKRAIAVEQYLVGAGIERDRLRVEGRGVLTDPIEAQSAGEEGAMEPYRIVRIKLGSDG